ncbi:MAG: hypothetical protein IKT67_13325 [Lachnospiraceae bacterium]|nr:hypothetical protein [Lachnospiraceae bacterium]
MTDMTEHALEYVVGGILFCIAIVMLLWLHSSFVHLTKAVGTSPERVILFEKKG